MSSNLLLDNGVFIHFVFHIKAAVILPLTEACHQQIDTMPQILMQMNLLQLPEEPLTLPKQECIKIRDYVMYIREYANKSDSCFSNKDHNKGKKRRRRNFKSTHTIPSNQFMLQHVP